jgi:hypothetical protein
VRAAALLRRIELAGYNEQACLDLAAGLIGHFVQAASGGALYRKASFLVDALGTPVFAPHIDLDEDPHRPGEFGSTPFDDEGVATAPRRVIDGGVLSRTVTVIVFDVVATPSLAVSRIT